MEPLNQNQLFTLLEDIGREAQPYTGSMQSISQEIPFSSWDAFEDSSVFEGKTIEQVRNCRMGIVALKAAFPHMQQRVQPFIKRADALIRESNPTVVSRVDTSKKHSSPAVPSSSSKVAPAERRAHIETHIKKQLKRADAYAAYQGKVFAPSIDERTHRPKQKEEYLRPFAKLLYGESYEMILNYHLVEPEAAQKIEEAFQKAQEKGKVFHKDVETPLFKGATLLEDRGFEILSDGLMSDS